MTQNEASALIEATQQEKQQEVFRYATVVGIFDDGCAMVRFFGENDASQKEYSYLSTYVPKVDDIVIMAKTADTYIILGKVLHKIVLEPEAEYVTTESLSETLENYVKFYNPAGSVRIDSGNGGLYSYINKLECPDLKVTSFTHNGTLKHNGNKAGFFGKAAVSQPSVSTLPTSDNLSQSSIIQKINTIITCLQSLGLFG